MSSCYSRDRSQTSTGPSSGSVSMRPVRRNPAWAATRCEATCHGGIVARTLRRSWLGQRPGDEGRRGFRGEALALERRVDAVAKLAVAVATRLGKRTRPTRRLPRSPAGRSGTDPRRRTRGSSRRTSRIAGRAWSISGGAESGSGNVARVSASSASRSPAMRASIASIVSGRNSRRGEAGGGKRIRCAALRWSSP